MVDETEDKGTGSDGSTREAAAAAATGIDVQSIQDLNLSIQQLITLANARPAAAVAREEVEEEVDPAELETMPRAAFAEHLVAKILAAVNKQVVEPINARLNEITANTSKTTIQGEVLRLGGERQADGAFVGGKFKDFWDYREEMLVIAREQPGLPPERLYRLARAENPAKAAVVDKKYAPKEAPGAPNGRVRLNFGGIPPGQSGTGDRSQNMKAGEAAQAAWLETVAALGGEPMFGEEA